MARAVAKTIRWSHDGRNEDGSAVVPTDFRSWSLEVNGVAALSVPLGWDEDGEYAISTAEMPVFAETGNYAIRLSLVVDGAASEYSAPANFVLEARKPTAPFGLSVA
jgi:hypothetical protein